MQTLGRTLEVRAKGKTSAAIGELMKLQPDEAVRMRSPIRKPFWDTSSCACHLTAVPGLRPWTTLQVLLELGPNATDVVKETTVAVRVLKVGDVVKIVPGARIPLDGEVVFGSSNVNEAMVTGESMPVSKAVGSSVIGGTVNCDGALRAQVTRVGEDTVRRHTLVRPFCLHCLSFFPRVSPFTAFSLRCHHPPTSQMLAQIVKLVEDAQTNKAPMQRYADRISAVFVPTVVLLSVAVFLFWCAVCYSDAVPEGWHEHQQEGDFLFSLLFGVSVLVIACPCALGLAVPTAVMVGTGVGACSLTAFHRLCQCLFTYLFLAVFPCGPTALTHRRCFSRLQEPSSGCSSRAAGRSRLEPRCLHSFADSPSPFLLHAAAEEERAAAN